MVFDRAKHARCIPRCQCLGGDFADGRRQLQGLAAETHEQCAVIGKEIRGLELNDAVGADAVQQYQDGGETCAWV